MQAVLPSIPNPKPSKSDKPCWYRYYAMFSEDFAHEVLSEAGLRKNSLVLDPWIGAGTTTVVAAKNGFRSIGVDINPAMIAIANGRCINRTTANAAVGQLEKSARKMVPIKISTFDPLLEWFRPSAANALRGWEQHIQQEFPASEAPVTNGFLLTILFEAAWELAAPYRSKNPTWVKKPARETRVNCRFQSITERLIALAKNKATNCGFVGSNRPSIFLGSSTKLNIESCADFVLTSPPYCTRIDYAVSTRVELAVLGIGGTDVEALRDAMMGTSTIRDAEMAHFGDWGSTCHDLLNRVFNHQSKSSANYYYKTFLQYFADLHLSLSEIDKAVKPGAGIVLVVQDSSYKGLRIDLAQVVTEMAFALGWGQVRRDDYPVRQTMRRVNTRSRQYLADPSSTESVLWFKATVGG